MVEAPRVVLASSNPGKLREFAALLAGVPVRLRNASPEELAALPEEGDQYEANARAKAVTVAQASGLPALADDSGLEVDGLGGAPGPLSARYGGDPLDDAGRVARLLAALAERPGAARNARFVCVAALALPDGTVHIRRGECPGRILPEPRGEGGFGYDPVFEPEGHTRSLAELPADLKNSLSHRGRALAGLTEELTRLSGG
ncbi:MAG: RdgB/HAM1 family non-canonical purine NTP pyrophosphatase [Planctomycetota bacterium]|nr:RdgB/HAM1 family non-canonical purine NTP pyrophosphatase [Planctomycetota bacterium]